MLLAYARKVALHLLCALAAGTIAEAQTLDVYAHANVSRMQGAGHAPHSSANVVVWLTPLGKDFGPLPTRVRQQYTLTQKDKQFTPHVLVVPVGSNVNFPNLDPFFHNVFSLFNGKRFDLGLYEAGSNRTVHFDREGVSYIFCNIHPEMGAVVVALTAPFYGVSSADGTILIRGVAPGGYRLSIWAENVPIDRLNALGRVVEISPRSTQLGTFELQTSGDRMNHHPNKFGDPYAPVPGNPY